MWLPPVNEEFARYGEGYFILAAPQFMPRWLIHADPRLLVYPGAEMTVRWIRQFIFMCAALGTWCLRRSWTVGVERRDIAGAADWKFIMCEEYRSFRAARHRRDEIVERWRDTILTDWRNGDYTPRPFIDAAGTSGHRPDPAT